MRMITTKYKEIMEDNTKAQELQLEHNTEKRKFKRTAALATAEDKHTKAQKLFKQGLTSLDELTELCSNEQGEICEQSNMVGKQRDALKHNIRVAVQAYGWLDWTKPFSKTGDKSVGKVPDLYNFLQHVMTRDGDRLIPKECYVKQPTRKVQREIGELTLQRIQQHEEMDQEDRTDITQRYEDQNEAAARASLPTV